MRKSLVAAFSLALLAGCIETVDNSGGEPPAGDSVTFEILTVPSGFWCEGFVDDAALMKDQAGIDAMLDTCQAIWDGGPSETPPSEALMAELDAGEPGDVLVFVEGSAGGCIGDAWIEDITLDGDVLRPWLLKEDSSYGQQDVGCTADWGVSQHLLRISGADAAASIELQLGVFNPELPGAPAAS